MKQKYPAFQPFQGISTLGLRGVLAGDGSALTYQLCLFTGDLLLFNTTQWCSCSMPWASKAGVRLSCLLVARPLQEQPALEVLLAQFMPVNLLPQIQRQGNPCKESEHDLGKAVMVSTTQNTWQEVCGDNVQTFWLRDGLTERVRGEGEKGDQDISTSIQHKEAEVQDNLFESQLC